MTDLHPSEIVSPAAVLRRSARPRTATEYVSDSLRRSILNGDLEGGTRLSLADIAASFDVSTTPVREALRELSFDGLVRIDCYRGGTVTAVTKEEVEEIVRIRQVLEPMAAREAVEGMTPQILAAAQAILHEMAASDSWDVWVQGNRAFHRKIYEASSSQRLVSLIKSLQDTQVVFVSATLRKSPLLKETATKDHNEMLEAIVDGDAERLVEVTLRHLTIPIETDMAEIPTCLPPVRETRQARLAVPAGSVDCHTHVFVDGYPMIPERGYNPPQSTLDDMLAMHAKLGIERVVLTQPSVYRTDNSAILDAVARIPDRARAVVAVRADVSDGELEELHGRGARGIRLNLDNVGGMPIEMDEVPGLVKRIGALGWHVEFLFPGHELPGLLPLLRTLDAPVSIGHFAYMPASEGVGYPPFQDLLGLVAEGNTWVKLSAPNRLGVGDLPPWPEVVPLARALIEANPDRMLWATDWPHPNKFETQPNDADLLEQLELWAPDEQMRRRILVDSPVALYGF